MGPDREVRMLYEQLLRCWNSRNGREFAALFADDGRAIGYDGSAHAGRAAIETDLTRIFADHATPAYVGLVREVRFLRDDVALVDAVAGMVPDGKKTLDPGLNAVQTLVAVKVDGAWRIALFQNTPAAYHGRPQLGERLTEDLREVLDGAGGRWMTGPSRSPKT
jgi:uncharacterized protein (TIGR02246 family)